MVRKPPRSDSSPPPAEDEKAIGYLADRDKIVDAFMALLAEQPFERIDFADVATRAGVSLAQLRDAFGSTLAILAAHIKAIDRKVLAGRDEDMAEEGPRERLFDVIMRRLEALAPHKEAIRSLLRSASRNPGLALALNGFAVRSQQWMLSAADIRASGPKGILRAQGLALLYAQVLRVWVHDDDPGLARTMAALDRGLARGQTWSGYLDNLFSIPERCRRRNSRSRRPRDPEDKRVAV
jgi:AcrR family transcriptional regulator